MPTGGQGGQESCMKQSVPRVLKVVVNSTFVLMDPRMEQKTSLYL